MDRRPAGRAQVHPGLRQVRCHPLAAGSLPTPIPNTFSTLALLSLLTVLFAYHHITEVGPGRDAGGRSSVPSLR